jgi:uncharacterized protein
VLPAPSVAIRLVLGEFAVEILGGQRIVGKKLEASGYSFQHADLDTAIRWLVA